MSFDVREGESSRDVAFDREHPEIPALPAADSREEAAFVPPEAHLSHGHRAVVRSRAGGRAKAISAATANG